MTDAELQAVRRRAAKAKCHVFAGDAVSGEALPRLEDVLAAAADVPALLAEVEALRRLLDGLAARVAAQAELLSRRAEGPRSPGA